MKAYTYIRQGKFGFTEKEKPVILDSHDAILKLIDQGKIDTTPLITHRFPLSRIEEAYDVFENKKEGVIKTAIYPG